MSKEVGKNHKLWWLIENGEIVDWDIKHPNECIVVEDAHDADGKLAWQGSYPDCAIKFITDGVGSEDFDDFMYEKSDKDGEYAQLFEYEYWNYRPCYPDYEADYDFSWKPVGMIEYSHVPTPV